MRFAASLGRVLLVAVAIGLVAGLGEVVAIGWRDLTRDVVTHVSPHLVWMAPVAYAGLALAFVPIALLVARGDRDPVPVAAFLALWPGLAGWTAMLPWGLHGVAVALLSGGVAFQLARWVARRADRVVRVARILAPGLSILVLAAAAAAFALEGRRGGPPAMAGASVSGSKLPNVLLLVLDTVRAKSLGLYGGDPSTSPNLDSLASTSIVFDWTLATAPWTLPSHASMFTGRWPHELSVSWDDPLDGSERTLAEELASRGYETAGFVANLSYVSRPYGLDRGFAHYEDFPVSVGQAVLSTSLGREIATLDALRAWIGDHELLNRKTVDRLNRDLLDWLDRDRDRPFFAFANYFDAHEPYEPPRALWEAAAPGYRRSDVGHRHNLLRGVNARRLNKAEMPVADVPRELAIYEAAIRDLDRGLGELFDALEARGLLESTLLVVTSDHGEQFGEHGIFDHGQSLYDAAVHVPLVIRLPGGAEGRRVSPAVSLRDLPATVMDLLVGVPDAFPGHSLAPLWTANRTDSAGRSPFVEISPAVAELHRGLVEQDWYPIASGQDMQSLLNGTLYYICNPDGSEELYDLASDHEKRMSLVGTAAGDSAVEAFRAAIAPVGAPPGRCPPAPNEPPRPPESLR